MLSFVLGMAIAASAAGAEPPGAKAENGGEEGADERGRRLRSEGDAFFANGELGKARAAYVEAWGLKKEYGIARDLGEVEARLGRHRDAAEHLSFYLREAPVDEAGRRRAQRLLREARRHVAEIWMTMNVPGATMRVDYVEVGVSPLPGPIYLDPGQHVLEARIDLWSEAVSCWFYAGESSTIALESPPPDMDKRDIEKWVAARMKVRWAQRDEVARIHGTSRAPAPPPAPPPAPALPPEEPRKSLFAIGVGSSAALVSMGLGLTATMLANMQSSTVRSMKVGRGGASECYRSTSADCQALAHAVSRLDDDTMTAGILWATGALFAGATVAYAILPMPWEKQSALRAAPWVGASGGGMSMGARF